jgi:hypothetical protein
MKRALLVLFQNFRLNTPVAAIGVRGTDFVVSASEKSIRALVNEGAIVAAPYSDLCSAESLGPCSEDAVELNGLTQQILEISTSAAGATAALLPANPAQTQQAVAAAATTLSSSKNKGKDEELYADTVSSRAVNQKLITPAPAPSVVPPSESIVQPVVVPEFTPDQPRTVEALTVNKQLVWGRYSEANLANERITLSHDTAFIPGVRVQSVGNFNYGLFRAESGTSLVQPGLGVLKFDLAQAQANYTSGGTTELMDVLGGNLQIDFEKERFTTDLLLSHAATGKIEFNEKGVLFPGGYFHPVNGNTTQSMAGAVSLDGKEAGYFFGMTLNNGSVEGLTLWNRQP